MESRTEMGLLLIIVGIMLDILSDIATLTAAALRDTLLSPGILIPAVLGLCAIPLLVRGWLLLFRDRKEFGREHNQFVIYSLVAFVVGVIIIIGGIVYSMLPVLENVLAEVAGEDFTLDYQVLAESAAYGLMASIAGGIIVVMGAVLLVYKLENDSGRRMLHLALAASIVVAVFSVILLSVVLTDFSNDLESMSEEDEEEAYDDYSLSLNAIGAMGVTGTFFVLGGYLNPYRRFRNRQLRPLPKVPKSHPSQAQYHASFPQYAGQPYNPYPAYRSGPQYSPAYRGGHYYQYPPQTGYAHPRQQVQPHPRYHPVEQVQPSKQYPPPPPPDHPYPPPPPPDDYIPPPPDAVTPLQPPPAVTLIKPSVRKIYGICRFCGARMAQESRQCPSCGNVLK